MLEKMLPQKSRKIYVVGGDTHYANWMEGTIVRSMDEADLVVFTGGEDVDPSLYKHVKNPRTHSNLDRDAKETTEFMMAKNLGKKMIGICRGAQFLCVMAGGSLIQHQENPGFIHDMWVSNIRFNKIPVTSTHHQAQQPYSILGVEYNVLGWTCNQTGKREDGHGNHITGAREVEIVHYRKIDALGIQPHPEMMYGDAQFEQSMLYFRALLDKLMSNSL